MSKRAPYTYGVDVSGKKQWRSLAEFSQSPEFVTNLAKEFPAGASELTDDVSRRSFIGLMGASLGLAGLQACRKPEEQILPYNKRPENLIPGVPRYFATAMPFAGGAIGLLVESHQGRPTKVEGNPDHPDSQGGATIYAQASVLDIYDVARSRGPEDKTGVKEWSDAAKALRERGQLAAGKQGAGLAILTESHSSPTLGAQLAKVREQWPNAKVYRWDPISRDNELEGNRLAFGRPLASSLETKNAKIIVALDADLFHAHPQAIRNARGYAEGRNPDGGAEIKRMYAVESAYSITGAKADHRLRIRSTDVAGFTLALAKELGIDVDASKAKLSEKAAKYVKAIAKDLQENKGFGLVAAGVGQPAFVHAAVALINVALGNVGAGVRYVQPFDASPSGTGSLSQLVDAMKKKEVETLVMLGGNPAFDGPGDLGFEDALKGVATSFHLSSHMDETGLASTWHLNRAHYLEQWSDVRAYDGTYSIVQPLIAPLHGSKTDAEVVELLLGGSKKAYDLVRQTFTALNFGDLGEPWRRAVHGGLISGSISVAEEVTPAPAEFAAAVSAWQPVDGVEVTFNPDSHTWNGSYANNGWLHEMPDPMTKLTWGNAALLSPSFAKAQGVSEGDVLEVTTKGGKAVTVPALIQPGQADDSIALYFGQGRRKVGAIDSSDKYTKVVEAVGSDVFPARSQQGFFVASGALRKTTATEKMARTQEHDNMVSVVTKEPKTEESGTSRFTGRPLAREGTLEQFKKDPGFAGKLVKLETYKEKPFNLFGDFKEFDYSQGHKWGMVIDLGSCIGCNACMVACQAENNIPLVGKDGVIRGREMHWIRVDRYFEGDDVDDAPAIMQPIACHHCENAPCELVCPVAATEHSPEGLNDIAYNRCVGTRYCANNCPYKVRRFNYFNYAKDIPELRRMQFNPDVTVRSRGVIEKCSYCVQRIQQAKIAAKREQRVDAKGEARVKDGEVVSACQQTCPTQAIKFGDLNDPTAAVAKAAASPRGYKLLEEINIRPRTSMLAQVRNPNPELEA